MPLQILNFSARRNWFSAVLQRNTAGRWLRRGQILAFAGQDLVAVEVAAVGQGGDLLAARGLLCLERHGRIGL